MDPDLRQDDDEGDGCACRSGSRIKSGMTERDARPLLRARHPATSAPMTPALSHIRAWIFDLDNTLYPASADLFGLMDVRMTAYVARTLGIDDLAEARRIQKGYFQAHGTTMAGLMLEHDVDPHHYLADVHDIDLDVLAEDARLARLIARLPVLPVFAPNAELQPLFVDDAAAAVVAALADRQAHGGKTYEIAGPESVYRPAGHAQIDRAAGDEMELGPSFDRAEMHAERGCSMQAPILHAIQPHPEEQFAHQVGWRVITTHALKSGRMVNHFGFSDMDRPRCPPYVAATQ